jgi:hypothetical protein
MSSTYLTFADTKAIGKILAEVRPPLTQGSKRETAAARFLTDHFKRAVSTSPRALLSEYIKELDARECALAQWNDEGGATGKAPRTEERRRIDNDTDGTRRRARESAARNQLL